MYTIKTIPYMKVYRQKVYMPKQEANPATGSMAILNNKTLDSSIKFLSHPKIIFSNSKYLNFYIDKKYNKKIRSKNIVLNKTTYQEDCYNKITDKYSGMRTPTVFNQVNKKNFYFDITLYNELFFNNMKSVTLKKRIELYFSYLSGIINDIRFNDYSSKTMYIDIESWLNSSDKINNPVMYINIAYRKFFNLFTNLGDIDIVLYNDQDILKINPANFIKDEFIIYNRELKKLLRNIPLIKDEEVDKEILKDEIKTNVLIDKKPKEDDTNINKTEDVVTNEEKEEIKKAIVKSETFKFTGDILDDEDENDKTDIEEFDNKINDKIESELEDNDVAEDPIIDKKELAEKIKISINTDTELVSDMHDIVQKKKVGKSTASLKRDEELRQRQKELKINNKTLDDYVNLNPNDFILPEIDISDKIVSTNENVKHIRFNNFEKSYNDNLMKSDTLKIITNLNNMSIPVYIKDIKIEDSSDELNYKDTYRVSLEDENRVRHSLTFDVPKFVDEKYLYLNGSKKMIQKQLFMKPIVKTDTDEVQVRTNYNTVFIRRYGQKISPKIEKLKKAISNSDIGIKVSYGDSTGINKQYKTILEYDMLAQFLSSIKSLEYEIIFNQDEIYSKLGDIKLDKNKFCIGFDKRNNPILVDYTTEKIGDLDIIDYIYSNAPEKFKSIYDQIKISTGTYTYSRATIMAKHVPLILLLGYCEGITEVLRKANINYSFSDKRMPVDDNKAIIKFEDGYFIYDRYPYENSLLLNALSILPTNAFKFEELDSKEIYVELFHEIYKARNLANAFDSFYEFLIDPITKEILADMDYPTDFVSVVLFANALLADNSYIKENNMNLYRVRSNEIVNAIIHREIADAYSAYRTTASKNTPTKISIQKDAIIKRLLSGNTIEEHSTLNPIYESDKSRNISTKGVNGLNVEKAYTMNKRAYDKSMTGLIGISTSPDSNVGVVRKLTVEPSVKGPRGYIDIKENDMDNVKDINMFTVAEMLTPMSADHDDTIRTAMSSKQSGHVIPVDKSSPVLISNGMEQTIQYNLSRDFIIVAADDGEVVEDDEKTGIMIVKYKNGESQAIDKNPHVVKNSSSGFYFSNKLQTDFKLGDKVKKNDIMAYEQKFFTNDNHNKNRFNIGSLQKVAVMSAYNTYEDSTFVTKKMSEEMASDIVMMQDRIIGHNSNINKIVRVGDEVLVGDTLIEFDTSYENDGINKFLDTLNDDVKDEFTSLTKNTLKAKYSGVVESIKIYCTVDLEDLSPTLQKIVSSYYSDIKKKKSLLEKYDNTGSIIKAGILFTEPTGKIKPTSDGKVKGRDVFDGVLIEFYIKYKDPISVGDKVTFYSALKSIVGEIIDEGYEPFSEYRPDEEISAFLGPSAILGRMVPSSMLVMFGNKVLIELKQKLKEIYEN